MMWGLSTFRVSVSGYSAIAIALGRYHTCAIVTGGTLKCWGYNGNGQLGIYNYNTQYSPVDVLGSGVTRDTNQTRISNSQPPQPRHASRQPRFLAPPPEPLPPFLILSPSFHSTPSDHAHFMKLLFEIDTKVTMSQRFKVLS